MKISHRIKEIKISHRITRRLSNYGLWISVASLLLIVMQDFGVHIVESNYRELVNALLSVFVGLGIINNPTTNNPWFGDDYAAEQTA